MTDNAQRDLEANVFAAYLLMPPFLFDPAIKDVDLFDEAKVAKIARKFRVPVAAVIFRASMSILEDNPHD